MKKIIYTLLVVLLAGGFISAQNIESMSFNRTINRDFNKKSTFLLNSKASVLDTVQFFTARLSNIDSAKALGLYSTSANTMGQYFECPQPLQVKGVSFYAYCSPAAAVNCTVQIFNCTADSLPSGAALASVVVSVDSSFNNGIEIFANFSSPVSVTGPYIMALLNNTTTKMYVISSNYKTQDGLGEGYAVAKLSTTWYHARELAIGGIPYDADFLINPIVSYTLANPTYTFSPTCIDNNTNVTFTQTNPAMYSNKFYNWWGFNGPDSVENQFFWDYGDGDFDMYMMNPSHTYVTANNYTTKLYYYFSGWTFDSEIDSVVQPIGPCTGIGENGADQISIYPNPASHYIFIENASNALVEIYNIYGSLILQKQNDNSPGSIDVSSLPEGNYIVKVTNDKTILTRKVFIER